MSELGLDRQGLLEYSMGYHGRVILADLVKQIPGAKCNGDARIVARGIAYDSRKVRPGDIFVAVKGSEQDGHKYIGDAISRGAVAVVAQENIMDIHSVPVVNVPDSRRALSRLASVYYDWPQEELVLVGITGTNGKTTTSYLIECILQEAGFSPAVIGTVNYRYMDTTCPAPVTTPESLDLMRSFRKVVDMGASHGIVEVSSHALEQGRVADCNFKVGVFTNLSRDHLDYHKTMGAYFKAKSILFKELLRNGEHGESRAVVNGDSPYGKRLADLCLAPVVFYGVKGPWEVSARDVQVGGGGLTGRLVTSQGETDFSCPLLGEFNLYNVLAATATSLCLGIPLDSVVQGLARVTHVPGRLEPIDSPSGIRVVVDYAHTPDALENAIRALRSLTQGRIITVFGCGGDRDKGKRPQMGRIGTDLSDLAIITSDNPRTEDPLSIIKDILRGVGEAKEGIHYLVEPDREKAIELAIKEATQEDLVLIAGKGHEDYQIIGTQKRYFDDREVAKRLLAKKE